MRAPMILADHPGHPRPLRFELGKGTEIGEQLRALAPEAFAAFEQQRGSEDAGAEFALLQEADPAPGEHRARPDQQ